MSHLEGLARNIRRHVVKMTADAKASHVASALSCVDILTALYFDLAELDPANPTAPQRDRIILSKGHAAPALYACLAERGFFPVADLAEYGQDGSLLAEHPSYGDVPGVECTTGSLGHGLGVATGIAKALQIDGRGGQVYAILSDGECNEGSVWEAALWAPMQKLGNLTAIIDFNKWQATGRSTEITALVPLADKWQAFGWEVLEIDGHDIDAICRAIRTKRTDQPRAIVAHTVKGKGVSFMENDLEWHYRPPSGEEYVRAMAELEDGK